MEGKNILTNSMINKAKLLAWAQAKTILEFEEIDIDYDPKETPREILKRYTPEGKDIAFCRIAINQTIHNWDEPVGDFIEMAIIPPVSGG